MKIFVGSKKIVQSIAKRFWFSKRELANNSHTEVSEEVRNALANNMPVVALESTILTHGMPYPSNVECALDVEKVVREQGAVPATISIIKGKIKVGTSSEELNILGDTTFSKPIKTSRRDLAFVIGNKKNGGTTVAGTLVVLNMVRIPIFATGGIGGVHRGAENTMDISADLIELGKSEVAVISSGVKSILDIPKTLEFLETQGVLVATLGENNDFPAFYSRFSGYKSPYYVNTPKKAAQVIKVSRDLNLSSGMLFAVPVPEEYSIDPDIINKVIDESLKNMPRGMEGKNITPYLLAEVSKITRGKSLESNIALIKNNAKRAAEIAVALSQLGGTTMDMLGENDVKDRPVIIGGTNLDCSVKLDSTEIKIRDTEEIIKNCPLLIMDGNLTKEAISEALQLADKHHIPVFFEPTDIAVCTRPFETLYWPTIKFITPNLSELKEIARSLKIPTTSEKSSPIQEAVDIGTKLLEFLENIIVTLGPDGIVIIRRGLASDNFSKSSNKKAQMSVRHYPTEEVENVVNVSGAGDCFASGFIAGMTAGKSEEICVSIGFASAKTAIYSNAAVPHKIFERSHKAWTTPASYNVLMFV